MYYKIAILFLMLTPLMSYGQTEKNYDFEKGIKGWIILDYNDNCEYRIDSTIRYNGNNSLHINPQETANIIVGVLIHPTSERKKIDMSYAIKKKTDTGANPTPFLQVGSDDIRYGNAKIQMIENGWEIHSVAINIDGVSNFAVGVVYKGESEIWLDNFKIKLDGDDITEDFIYQNIKKDKEFDNGSKISIIDINRKNINNLYLLCKIWGVMKYYHPNIANGNYNWDYELFRIIPLILNNDCNFNSIISDWIDKINDGDINEYKQKSQILGNSLFEWITPKNIGTELHHKLSAIICNSNNNDNCYISSFFMSAPKFDSENAYKTVVDTDCGYRLLALFRAWNVLEYFAPYKDLTDKNWNDVLKKYIPLFIKNKTEDEYFKCIRLFLAELCDNHTMLNYANSNIKRNGISKTIPIIPSNVRNKCVVEYASKDAFPIKTGDVITHINGEKLKKSLKKHSIYTSFSNVETMKNGMYYRLLRAIKKDSVEIKWIGDKKKMNQYIKTTDISYEKLYWESNNIVKNGLIQNNIGYINLEYLNETEIDSLFDVIKNTEGIVLDLRGYPKGTLYKLGKYLMPKETIFAKFKTTSLKTPGIFNSKTDKSIGITNPNFYKGKVVIIVNNRTISQAEFTAMGLSVAPNAIVIGSQTSGADGDITWVPLPGGYLFSFSSIGIYYPNGGVAQRVGVRIDEIVKPTIKGIREGRDEVLERAIEIIHSQE